MKGGWTEESIAALHAYERGDRIPRPKQNLSEPQHWKKRRRKDKRRIQREMERDRQYLPRNPSIIAGRPRKNWTPGTPLRSGLPAEAFLDSDAWRQLRYQVIVKRGRKCECCGATPAEGAIIQVDHIKPRSKFPDLALTESNLQILCKDCNLGKGNRDSIDWRARNRPK